MTESAVGTARSWLRRTGAAGRCLGFTLPLILATISAAAVAWVGPRAVEAGWQLALRDDPAALADRALAGRFDAAAASREIEAALAAEDVDLAASLLALARERQVPVGRDLAERVEAANGLSSRIGSAAKSFAHGFVVGAPDDLAGLAGTTLGDLFVYGDIRDAVREGTHLASGEQVDEIILGLACVGLAVTAATYATLGAGTSARAGLTLAKAARKTGRLGGEMSSALGRSLREAVDLSALRQAAAGAFTNPAAAARAARASVRIDKAGGLVRLAGVMGRVQSKAGTRAALEGLRLSESPRDMSRIARLAEAKGGKTRAVLKLLGRGAFTLTMAAFDIASWLLGLAFSVLGFVASIKRMVERTTLRCLHRRKATRARALATALPQG